MITPVEKGQAMTRHRVTHPVGFSVSHKHMGAQLSVPSSVLRCRVATSMTSPDFCPITLHVTIKTLPGSPAARRADLPGYEHELSLHNHSIYRSS